MRALGEQVGFFTSRKRPLRTLAGLTQPGAQVASAHLDLGRGVLTLLQAAAAPIDPAATALMTLLGPRHLSTVFAARSPVQLLLVRETAGLPGARQLEQAGAVRVVFRDSASGQLLGAPIPDGQSASAPPPATVPGGATDTSFGRLLRVERASHARQRHFAPAKIDIETRQARPGHGLVRLHIERDFGRGVGTVSFLYGSGVIVEADFARLQIEADGHRLRPMAVFDEGATLELAYEVRGRGKQLFLIDGDARLPLALPPAPVAASP